MAEIFAIPVPYHIAAAAKEAITIIGTSNELKQFSLALDKDHDALFRLVKEVAIYTMRLEMIVSKISSLTRLFKKV